ncbi:MAG: ABC transporter permease [Chloroflexota bacterium]
MRDALLGFWKGLVHISAFVRKEIFVVIRQPQLLLGLILGPFLILLVFGVGYRNEARTLRTLFIAHPQSELGKQIEIYAPTLGSQLEYMGVTGDIETALQRLRRGEVDLVAVAPDRALESIRTGRRAAFRLYHQEIDPLQVGYIGYFGQFYTDELNERILYEITVQGQAQAEDLHDDLETAEGNADRLERALQSGNEALARQILSELSGNLDEISLAVGGSLAVLTGVEQMLGERDRQANETLALLDSVRRLTDQMQRDEISPDDADAWEPQVAGIRSDLERLQGQLETFTQLDADVIISPFTSQVHSVVATQPDMTTFYAPAVIALLIQHLAVAIAALSIVQENSYGTLELFRVSPLSAAEILIGKYVSYLIFGAAIAAILTLLMRYGIGVPILGHWANYALVITLLLFASLGIGFFISLISHTDSQAVQYTMIVLLTSVFFGGLIMSLNMLWEPVRAFAWTIPTTLGTVLLRDIALRGNYPDTRMLGGLALIGVSFCILAWLLLRGKIRQG